MSKLPSFPVLATIQTAVVMIAFIAWWVARTAAYVDAPIGPHDEYYSHCWRYQLIAGGIYCLPMLAIVAGILILERWMVDVFSRINRNEID